MKILLADDQWFILESMQRMIEHDMPDYILHTAPSLDSALEVVRIHGPFDLVILDLNMPGMNGLEGIVTMRKAAPNVPVAIMSADEDPEIIRQVMAAGAGAYLPKSLGRDNTVAAIRMITQRSRLTIAPPLDPQDPPSAPSPAQLRASQIRDTSDLTNREKDVFPLVLQGLPRKKIAADLGLAEQTVKEHIARILRKKQCRTVRELLAAAQGLP